MAVVRNIERGDREPKLQPTDVDCAYHVLRRDGGATLIQFDTGGSDDRQDKGKQSQTLQFDSEMARRLWEILGQEFGFND